MESNSTRGCLASGFLAAALLALASATAAAQSIRIELQDFDRPKTIRTALTDMGLTYAQTALTRARA